MRDSGRESFEAWARARQQVMVRNAYLLTGDYQRAEDLVQEALIRAAQRWDVLEDGNPDGWVRSVIYRQHVSWWRKTRRESSVEQVPDSPVVVATDGSLALMEAFARLTPRQRAVMILRYIEDRTVAETALVLGVTDGTVKKQSALAIERLRSVAPELGEREENRT